MRPVLRSKAGNRWWCRSLGLALALFGTPAAAVEIADFGLQTTSNLVALCGVEPNDPLAGEAQQACFGYIGGVVHFYRALTDRERIEPFVCPGRELTRNEIADIFTIWAAEHPEHADDLPVESLVRAAVDRFPCPTSTEE